MSEMFLMRRADGNFFIEEIDGKRVVPVWSSEESLARYKERNPGLMTFLATQLTRSMIQKIPDSFSWPRTIPTLILPTVDRSRRKKSSPGENIPPGPRNSRSRKRLWAQSTEPTGNKEEGYDLTKRLERVKPLSVWPRFTHSEPVR